MLILGGVALLSSAAARAATVVDATASVYSSGSGSTPAVAFDVTSFAAIRVSASGLVTLSPPFDNDPDGVGSLLLPHNVSGVGGLSGISLAYAGGLVGAFVTASGPMPGDPVPATLAYGASDLGFASFATQLNQVFFVGDGLTGDGVGSPQTFFVPVGATRLLLGFADAPGYQGAPDAYYDNAGSLTVSIAAVPEPASWTMMVGGIGFIGGALRRRRASRPHEGATA